MSYQKRPKIKEKIPKEAAQGIPEGQHLQQIQSITKQVQKISRRRV